MSREEGVKFTCQRCGKEEFVPFMPLAAKYGNNVESKWMLIDHKKDIWICPRCGERFKEFMEEFLKSDPLKL